VHFLFLPALLYQIWLVLFFARILLTLEMLSISLSHTMSPCTSTISRFQGFFCMSFSPSKWSSQPGGHGGWHSLRLQPVQSTIPLAPPHFSPLSPSTHNCLRWRRHGSKLQEEDNISPWKYISIDSYFIRVVLEYRGPLLSADSFSIFQFV
jgi:hypothetical protein